MSGSEKRSWVLVTGASGEIGRVLVERFRLEGFRVIGTDLGSSSGECNHFISCDLKRLVDDEKVRQEFYAEVADLLGNSELAALVNNAAVQVLGSVPSLAVEDFSRTLDINVVAPFVLTQLFFAELTAASGAVVNISSIHARLTKPQFVAYATSKAALSGLTRAMGVEIGDRVRVNAIAPAAIDTPMLTAGLPGADGVRDSLARCHPVGRIGHAAEVADLALFLVSDKATFINGAVFGLDGGIAARLHDVD